MLQTHLFKLLATRPSLMTLSRNMTSTYKGVIFDMGGVLINNPAKTFREFEKAHNLPARTVLITILSSGEQGAWAQLERGEVALEQFTKLFNSEIANRVGKPVDVSGMLYAVSEKPFPEMLDCIRCLRADGFKTALLTNNWFIDGEKSLQPVDPDLFDVVIESCKVGCHKPDPRIYQLCVDKLGIPPSETVYLDDLGNNLKPAKQLGMHTIKVTSTEQVLGDLETVLGLSVRGYAPGTKKVSSKLALDQEKLRSYLATKLNVDHAAPLTIRSFTHGQSNPTYYITFDGKALVLRKKPPGKLLPSAHAVEREFRVMQALRRQGVPLPEVLDLCVDESILGTPFYIMEYQAGRIFTEISLPDLPPAERTQIFDEVVRVLSLIHSADINNCGYDPSKAVKGGFVARNLERWWKQFDASRTEDMPMSEMDSLVAWLRERLPQEERTSVVHGDYRLDNLIFHPTENKVIGVLDWELSTLGDPITDLATICLPHLLPGHFPIIRGYAEEPLPEGIPSMEQLIELYCRSLKVPVIENMDFYMAFTAFRMAAILQGVYKRAISGQASSPQGKMVGSFAGAAAQIGWKVASSSRLGPTGPGRIGGGPPARGVHSQAGSLPLSVDALRPEVQTLHKRVRQFIKERVLPMEDVLVQHATSPDRWKVPVHVEKLKSEARAQGLWNLFLPIEADPEKKYGAGLTNVEYAFICEEMGRSLFAPEVFNCSAPDTGNMEVLVRYGSPKQQERWLKPLLAGEIRSCFGMTEPAVASSDATNISTEIRREGDDYVINGRKWWTSGVLHPECKLCILMGKTDSSQATHKQQSMILVPMDAPGIRVVRPLSVFGFEDPPFGHGEVVFENVRVPAENILLGEGRGFEIAQGRLGPGRIHHCMRLIGHSERALELMIDRVTKRIAFGKPLAAQGTIQKDIALSRLEIEQTRLLVLKTAHMMDTVGNKGAAAEIAMIKVSAPNMTARVLDRVMQAHGGAGLSQDFPLAAMFAWSRVLRIADGPDEVHIRSIAKHEFRRHAKV